MMRHTLAKTLLVGAVLLLAGISAQADLIYTAGNGCVGIIDLTQMPLSAILFETPEHIWYGSTDSPDPASFYATDNMGALYKVTPYDQSVTKIGDYQPGGYLDIKELAYNEDNHTLYGTDYSNLYTINQTTGVATLVGNFGNGFDGNPIQQVYSMDYDPSVGQLVIIDQVLNPDFSRASSEMYYVDTTTGAAFNHQSTGENGVTDIYRSVNHEDTFGVGNAPDRMFWIDSTSGDVYEMEKLHHNFTGMGGELQYSPGPGITLMGGADCEAYVHVMLEGMEDEDYSTGYSEAWATVELGEYPEDPDNPGPGFQVGEACAHCDSWGYGLNCGLSFDAMYEGENSPGNVDGYANLAFSGMLEIDAIDAPGGEKLMLLVRGSEYAAEWEEFGSFTWELLIYGTDPLDPIIQLDSESIALEGVEWDQYFLGAAVVEDGDVYFIELNLAGTFDSMGDWYPYIAGGVDLHFDTIMMMAPV
ncbi:MAG: hypothetical protein JXA52_10275, partial [Planctomycetes bacterium]|nr:hypothetical protein [Planctomycetota bacterium]